MSSKIDRPVVWCRTSGVMQCGMGAQLGCTGGRCRLCLGEPFLPVSVMMHKRFGKTRHQQTQTAIHVCCPGEQGTPIVCEGALKHEFGKTGRYGRKLRGGRWLITSRNCIPLEHSKRDARGQGLEHGRPLEYIWNNAALRSPPVLSLKQMCCKLRTN